MELQALLVLCGIGVTGAAVLLLMGLFSASGTSYEEAIAQQRRATNELLALAENKNKSKKTNKKANKKLAKKEKKEHITAATGSEPESEAPAESGVDEDTVPTTPHVEFSPPVVVELPTDTPPNIKIRKRGKDPKVKPILINKEDPSCVSDPSAAATPVAEVSNHFEEMHPKDDFELLHATLEKVTEKKEEVAEKKEHKVSKQVKNGKAAPKQSQDSVKEEITRDRPNNGDAPLEQRKVKKLEKKVASETASEEVVPPLNVPQPSELTTDKLLRNALPAAAPAHPAPPAPAAPAPAPATSPPAKGKKKKTEQNMLAIIGGDGGGVSASELVRVVREAALSRTDIQVLTDALLNKHHDQLPEHSEWTEGPNDPMQKLKKQLADKEKALADEIEASQALHAKLKELRTNLNAERGRASAASRAAEQAAAAARAELHTLQARLQRLLDDNHALAQDKLMLQSKLSEESEAQAQRVQMEMHIQRLSEAEAALVAQLGALQAEAGARAVEAGQARCDAAAARDAALLAQQHGAELAQQLQEANRVYAELEQQRQCAVHAEQLAQQELRQLQARLAGLTEAQNEVQRLTSRAQAAESAAEKIKEDMEKDKQELSKEIAQLREQLAARETELAELKQLKAVPAQNGLPPTSNTDGQKAAELAKVESVVEALRNELASAQKSSSEQREQLASLQEQLAQYREKNNELRTKNWKVMEALQTAEKALATRATPAMPAQDAEAVTRAEAQHFNEVANVLRSVCPTIAPTSKVGMEWLQTFANTLKKELEAKEAEKKRVEQDLASKLLEKDNERKQLETVLQKKIQEKELLAKEIESKLQQQIQEKEFAKNRIESELQQKLKEELTFRKQVESELHKKKEVKVVKERVEVTDESRVKDLEAQNEHLQSLVDKYKRIIDDTEGVLSRLQQNVTREEQRWAQQLADKQRDLDTLRSSTVLQMQNKIDSLQAELQKLQSKNHSNSFADAERLTEERLMAGLSDKHDTDVHNGPIQVGLVEN
ncbi:ribosome-binding protein 1 isoform X1 [Vanessa atalanta]|uniref:ribosome-binding protein 1 isoform X1 n=1 Tax=Vanessa atalanta TaxID=42275 RepID=UPI001FCDAB6C|nr:ribosome-binding protein 1 isoform X1 [Vanessa atalanta]XP_047536696.1 ribosome-binding protein 1 isoform X1 [Vanessa atalanta]XP_047536697.1 ribosome-binding protein 1 isoform X1 [Vanessa atalanta]